MLFGMVGNLSGQEANWQTLSDGLQLGRFKADAGSLSGDSIITVLRVDPNKYEFHVLARSNSDDKSGHTSRNWCEKYHLTAAINAGMYAEDHSTHIGYMKIGEHINNGRVVQTDYRSVAAFHPLNDSLPPFRMFDLDEIEFDSVRADYATVIQNIRLIKRPGENRWPIKPKKWSEAALGEDSDGFLLMIFCRSPYTMYQFNEILLSLPINIVCAQHLEGGSAAQLYLKQGATELELTGRYETGFLDSDANLNLWRIPNIIGISKR
jgi:hypothetical protein